MALYGRHIDRGGGGLTSSTADMGTVLTASWEDAPAFVFGFGLGFGLLWPVTARKYGSVIQSAIMFVLCAEGRWLVGWLVLGSEEGGGGREGEVYEPPCHDDNRVELVVRKPQSSCAEATQAR